MWNINSDVLETITNILVIVIFIFLMFITLTRPLDFDLIRIIIVLMLAVTFVTYMRVAYITPLDTNIKILDADIKTLKREMELLQVMKSMTM